MTPIDLGVSQPNTRLETDSDLTSPDSSFDAERLQNLLVNPITLRNPTQIPEQLYHVTLEDVLLFAIQNTSILRDTGATLVRAPEASTSTFDPTLQRSDPNFGAIATSAEFDPNWYGQLNNANNDRVFNNATLGGGATELRQDLANARVGIQKRTWAGSLWDFSQSTVYDANNRAGNFFPSSWEQTLEASWRKPLLRGAGKEFNAIAGPNARPGLTFSHGVWIAQLREDAVEEDFTAKFQTFLETVEDSYWQLHLAYERHAALERSTEIAEQVYKTVNARYQAGIEGGEADREAEAKSTWYRFQQQRLKSISGVTNTGLGIYLAELELRRLIGFQSNDASELLYPISKPPAAPVYIDADYAIEQAMVRRAELRKQSLRVQEEELRLIAAKNFTKPQLDLVSRYRLRGFGQDWWGTGPRFQSAWQDIGTMDHQEWDFGLEAGAPHQQRVAKQAMEHARINLAKSHAILREMEQSISFAIVENVIKTRADFENLKLASATLEAAQQRLDASYSLFMTDKATLDRVREAQEAWQIAKEQLTLATLEYAKSIRRSQIESGTYLSDLQISIEL